MESQVIEIVISICLGFLGTPTRIFAQYIRDGTLPDSNFSILARAFISSIAGLIYYLITGWGVNDIRVIALGGLMAGYVGVDFVENALGGNPDE